MVTVAISRRDNIEKAIQEALGTLDLEPVVRGKIVAVKPNETYATPDDMSGVTQADTLRAVLRYVKRFNPHRLVVSGGAGAGETEDILRLTGMMDALLEEGAEFFDHNRGPFISVDLEYAPDKDVRGPQKNVMVNPRVLEYESLISICQLKLHATATVTLSLKNIAMSFPAADYYGHPRAKNYHEQHFFEDMHSFIAAMAKRFPISLAIITGHPAMIGSGPVEGHAVETGLVIASRDPLAADVVGAKILGFRLQAVRHLWEAAQLGVGKSDVADMEFPLLNAEQAVEAFSEAAYGEKLSY